jgi:hypothetical protein
MCIKSYFIVAVVSVLISLALSTSLPTSCSAYPACAALGLKGECCPTIAGVNLDCCKGGMSVPTPQPVKAPTQPTATCSSNPKCSALGLTEDCCPTKAGVQLDCCQGPVAPQRAPTRKPTTKAPIRNSRACSARTKCKGLVGNCCPTNDGVFLDCCKKWKNAEV